MCLFLSWPNLLDSLVLGGRAASTIFVFSFTCILSNCVSQVVAIPGDCSMSVSPQTETGST